MPDLHKNPPHAVRLTFDIQDKFALKIRKQMELVSAIASKLVCFCFLKRHLEQEVSSSGGSGGVENYYKAITRTSAFPWSHKIKTWQPLKVSGGRRGLNPERQSRLIILKKGWK